MLNFLENEKSTFSETHLQKQGYVKTSLENTFFPVEQKSLFYYNDFNVPVESGSRALLRSDSGQILYVGSEYSPVMNKELYTQLSRLEDYGWQGQDVRTLNNKVFCYSYINPDIKFTIAGLETNPQVAVFNSYDGTVALKMFIGGIIKVCSNGLIIGKGTEFKRKHTGEFNLNEFIGESLEKTIAEKIKKVESKVWEEEDTNKLEKIWKQLIKPFPNSVNGKPNKIVYALNQRFAQEQRLGYKGEQAMMMAATHVATHDAHVHPGAYIFQLEQSIPKVFFN